MIYKSFQSPFASGSFYRAYFQLYKFFNMSYISYSQIDILEQLPILIGPDFDWYIFLFLSPIAFSRHLG